MLSLDSIAAHCTVQLIYQAITVYVHVLYNNNYRYYMLTLYHVYKRYKIGITLSCEWLKLM